MNTPSNTYFRIGIILASQAAFVASFIVLYPETGSTLLALVLFPAAIAGWLFGVRGGLVYGILNLPLTYFLLILVGDIALAHNYRATFIGSAVVILISMAIGWAKAIMDGLKQQTDELLEERKIIEEEVEKTIRLEEQLLHEALHDPLTNLPNRRMFANRLESAVDWNHRNPDSLLSMIYLDFDRFKIINDSLGHSVGDQLLIELAQRLKSSVSKMDTVARMGGDEFAILLVDAQSYAEVLNIVKRLQQSLTVPVEVLGNSIVMTASIGIIVDLRRYEQIDDIIRDADIAMYSAKNGGKNRYALFDVAMRENVGNILKLESDLNNALRNGDFRLHYQPIHSLMERRLTGFEALLRWQHPERGLLQPVDFMKGAEESGLIVPIGQWALSEACRQMKQWQTQFSMDPPLTISVNLSSQQFSQPDLIRQIQKVLEETALPANSLLLELTEMTLVEDIETALVILKQLRKLGVKIEVDGFGTKNSPIGFLGYLPINHLKIDRSFTSTLGDSESAVPIIRAIVAIANSLGMKVIAEGIETEDQLNELVKLECDCGQGFLFHTSVDSQAAQQLIKEARL